MHEARPAPRPGDLPFVLHQVFTHESQDGTFRAWDATVGRQIAETGHELMAFPLEHHGVTTESVHAMYEGLDETYAMGADLTRPLLFIPLQGEILLIDGHHRLFKAARLGIPELPMYLLTQEEARSVLLLEVEKQ